MNDEAKELTRAIMSELSPHARDAYLLAYIKSALDENPVAIFGEAGTIQRLRDLFEIAAELKGN